MTGSPQARQIGLWLRAIAVAAAAGGSYVFASATVTLDCEREDCHVATWFRGEGGFVGEVVDGNGEVVFLMECGDVFVSGSASPDERGVVARALNEGNGWHCDEDDGGVITFQGLRDGAWYWVTGGTKGTAAMPLLPREVLANRRTPLVDPRSPSIVFATTKDGSLTTLHEVTTGEFAILPRIWPSGEPRRCGPRPDADGSYDDPRNEVRVNCSLGDGGTRTVLTPGHTVVRPVQGRVLVTPELWLNESGSVSTASPPTPAKGWKVEGGSSLDVIEWRIRRPSLITTGDAGIQFVGDGSGRIAINADTRYCDSTLRRNHPVSVEILALARPAVVPPLRRLPGEGGAVGVARLTVKCPSSSQLGRNLVSGTGPLPPNVE